MFFIGIFSTPLPYLAIFSIYLIGMINYSFHAKGEKGEICDQDKTVKLDKYKRTTHVSTSTVKTTHFFDHFYQDQTHDQAICLTQSVHSARIYHTQKHSVYKPHYQTPVFSSHLFIRPPPYLL